MIKRIFQLIVIVGVLGGMAYLYLYQQRVKRRADDEKNKIMRTLEQLNLLKAALASAKEKMQGYPAAIEGLASYMADARHLRVPDTGEAFIYRRPDLADDKGMPVCWTPKNVLPKGEEQYRAVLCVGMSAKSMSDGEFEKLAKKFDLDPNTGLSFPWSTIARTGARMPAYVDSGLRETAMRKGRVVRVKANLKQIHIALTVYEADNPGTYPVTLSALGSYIDNAEVLRVPGTNAAFTYHPANPAGRRDHPVAWTPKGTLSTRVLLLVSGEILNLPDAQFRRLMDRYDLDPGTGKKLQKK